MDSRIKDISGNTYGSLKVIKLDTSSRGSNHLKWYCRCSCGSLLIVRGDYLKEGRKTHCGCGLWIDGRYPPIYRRVIKNYKSGARRRGLEWSLTDEQALSIIIKPCYYCGDVRTNRYDTGTVKIGYIEYNGIDRVDNEKGYELDNVVPCCKDCNFMKGTKSLEEFKDKISKIYLYAERGYTTY